MTAMRQKAKEMSVLISTINCNVAIPSRETGHGAFIRVSYSECK